MGVVYWLVSILLLLFPVSIQAASYEELSDLSVEQRYTRKLEAAGRYEEALAQAQRVYATSRKLLGEEHRMVAMSLDSIASILRRMGRFAESETYFVKALQISRKQQQANPHDYAIALQNLAGLYRETGRYQESERLYGDALVILKKTEPLDNDAVMSVSGNLAMLYQNQGRYAEAEPFLKAEYDWALKAAEPDKMAIRMNLSMDGKRLFLAERMSSLAGLYLKMRRIAEATELTAAALTIKRQILKDDDPRVAREMNNLGMIYRNNNREKEAEPLLLGAVAAARKVYGNRHPELAVYLDNLAMLYQSGNSYQQAEKLHREAIAISGQVLGTTHANTLMQRNNLAVTYLMQDRYVEAERLLRGILEDSRAGQGGIQHPEAATRINNLASALRMQGRHLEANRLQAQAIRISERKRDDLFFLLTEQQKLSYLRDEMLLVRLHLAQTRQVLAQDPGAATGALDVWLRWKGIVMESQGRYLEALHRSDNPDLKRLFGELTSVRRDLAGLRLMQPASNAAQSHWARIEQLEYRKETLEADLTRRSSVYAKAGSSRQFSVEELQKLLRKDTAYIDFALVEDWNFQPLAVRGFRYLAFIATGRPGAMVQMLDLGPADAINRAITAFRSRIAAGSRNAQERNSLSADLHALVMAPLLPHLTGIGSLIISPDSALHLVPFEVLHAANQPYMLEKYAVSYVASGRDMARFGTAAAGSGEALILADPDYDLKLDNRPGQGAQGSLVDALKTVHFTRLPDTGIEANAIAQLLKKGNYSKILNLTGSRALESSLFSQPQPRLVHLATHGFFLQEGKSSDTALETRGLKAVAGSRPDAASPPVELVNPMLRSGIALAGVNRSLSQGRDEGLVTAEKILGLRLSGTDLVTLSACETGVGDVRAGEGVFGLKRAFILAGARTVVLSLWSVPSRETTELMTEFYRLMASGSTKAAALRQAQRNMLKKYPHPFYWGAFQLVGSPD